MCDLANTEDDANRTAAVGPASPPRARHPICAVSGSEPLAGRARRCKCGLGLMQTELASRDRYADGLAYRDLSPPPGPRG